VNNEQTNPSIIVPLVLSIIAISFAAIFVKWSEAPATILSMYRMYFACFLLVPIVWGKRDEFKRLTKNDWLLFFGAGLFLALHFALWFGSLKLTTVASSTIILALQPIVALSLGFIFFKERASRHILVTMAVAVLGAIMVGWGDIGLSQQAIIGDLLSFLSVIAVVCYLIIGQSVVKKVSHWIYSFSVFAFAALLLTIYNLITSVPFTGYDLQEWGIFLLLAIVPTIAHVIHNWLLNYVNATTISMSILGEPVGATALAIVFLGERLNVWQVIGSLFVLSGVFFFLLQQQHRLKYGQDEERVS
jgi:drug/metabolite transporter (DMT)-like permease